MSKQPLKIGYVYQSNVLRAGPNDPPEVTAPALHITHVVRGFEKQGHNVKTIKLANNQAHWSDDLASWLPITVPAWSGGWRSAESLIRGIQSRLKLPYLNLFESSHFADGVKQAFIDRDIIYERYGLLNFGGLMAAHRLQIPHVVEINGDIVAEYERSGIELSDAQWAFANYATRIFYRMTSHIVVVDEALSETLQRRWAVDPAKISVVRNGTDFELFSAESNPTLVREKYGLQPSGPLIGFVGGFQPWHGIEELITAFAKARATSSDAQLVLIGDGPARASCEQTAAALNLNGAVKFLGARAPSEVAEAFSIVDIAAAPYKNWRALAGMKVYEHMASGNAIITTAQNRQHPVLTHLDTGYLIESNDNDQLADAMLHLLQDGTLRAKLGRNAQHISRTTYTWEHTVAKLEAICYGAVAASK